MHALIETTDTWLATPRALRSTAVRDRLLERLKHAPREENWPFADIAAATNRIALLEKTASPELGFPGCSARG